MNEVIERQGARLPGEVSSPHGRLPDDDSLYGLSELFRVFGDYTRVRILCALYNSEMCVCDLSELLNTTQSNVSHQLRILRANRLVKYRRVGKTVIYSLDDEHIFSIISLGMEHIKE